MENRIIDMLLGIKSDIGELKKGQVEIKDVVDKIDGRVCSLEDDVADTRSDIAEVKTDVAGIKQLLTHCPTR
jgi:hypothetical protein